MSSQIPDPVKIFIVFPIPAEYFGQIPDPETALSDYGTREKSMPPKPVTRTVSKKQYFPLLGVGILFILDIGT